MFERIDFVTRNINSKIINEIAHTISIQFKAHEVIIAASPCPNQNCIKFAGDDLSPRAMSIIRHILTQKGYGIRDYKFNLEKSTEL